MTKKILILAVYLGIIKWIDAKEHIFINILWNYTDQTKFDEKNTTIIR